MKDYVQVPPIPKVVLESVWDAKAIVVAKHNNDSLYRTYKLCRDAMDDLIGTCAPATENSLYILIKNACEFALTYETLVLAGAAKDFRLEVSQWMATVLDASRRALKNNTANSLL